MHKRPFALFCSALLFLYFPATFLYKWLAKGNPFEILDFVLEVICPFVLLAGLIRVTRTGWYTLVGMVSLWGVMDLYDYYMSQNASPTSLLIHLGIYCLSLGYFINPRIRHLYFDPKMRWWRIKPRYETHMAFMLNHQNQFHYPILRNISEGGCFVETPHLLELNSPVEINIPLPVPLGVSVIKTQGEVRWVSKNPLRYGMGVQFREPLPEHSRAIKDFVRRHL